MSGGGMTPYWSTLPDDSPPDTVSIGGSGRTW